jgi:hypothetical protein
MAGPPVHFLEEKRLGLAKEIDLHILESCLYTYDPARSFPRNMTFLHEDRLA